MQVQWSLVMGRWHVRVAYDDDAWKRDGIMGVRHSCTVLHHVASVSRLPLDNVLIVVLIVVISSSSRMCLGIRHTVILRTKSSI